MNTLITAKCTLLTLKNNFIYFAPVLAVVLGVDGFVMAGLVFLPLTILGLCFIKPGFLVDCCFKKKCIHRFILVYDKSNNFRSRKYSKNHQLVPF